MMRAGKLHDGAASEISAANDCSSRAAASTILPLANSTDPTTMFAIAQAR